MLGILLLLVSIFFYRNRKFRIWSIFLYFGFLLGTLGGYNILTDSVIGVKNIDIALLFMLYVVIYKWSTVKHLFKERIGKFCILFTLFIFISSLFSIIYYDISWSVALRASRSYYLINSYFVFRTLGDEDFKKILSLLLKVTYFTSIIYILQIIVGRPLMPYPWDYSYEGSFHIIRLYNFPTLLVFFLLASFSNNSMISKPLKYRIVYFLALCATMGRTMFVCALLGIFILIMLEKKKINIGLIISMVILIIPVYHFLEDRFIKGNTSTDFENLKAGDYKEWRAGTSGTMTYRIAWLYERWDYMEARPLSEKFFGLGFIGEGERQIQKMYNFYVGLKNNRGEITQLATPDIMYGDVLTHLGIGGGLLYFWGIYIIILYLWKNRNKKSWVRVAFVTLFISILESFSGSLLAYPKNLSIYLFIIAWTISNGQKNQSDCCNSVLQL